MNRRDINTAALFILAGLFGAALIAAGVWIQIDVWQECRVDHSFFYCWHLISR